MTIPEDTTQKPKKIIIEGVTEQGDQFRPSDWAERMSGSLCTFRNRRITYSPLLQPMVQGGNKCVLLDPKLKETNPELYESIMEFVKENKLKVKEEDPTGDEENPPPGLDPAVKPRDDKK